MSKNNFIKKRKAEKRKIIFIQILILIMFLLVWEIFASLKIIDVFLFSKPSNIFNLLVDYLEGFEIFRHIGISVLETIIGLVLGTVLGLLIAIIIWWFDILAKIIDPYLVVLNALPKTALAPIIIIWAGTGIKGITVVAISISLVITILSAYNYFNNVEIEKIKMLKSYNATKFQILTKLILPMNISNIVNIIKINIGMSWIGVIVGEFIVSREGIGYLIVYGSQVFNLDLVMMGVIVLGIIAFIMYEIVNVIEIKIKKKRGEIK